MSKDYLTVDSSVKGLLSTPEKLGQFYLNLKESAVSPALQNISFSQNNNFSLTAIAVCLLSFKA